jgi:phosphoenolpyruvate carboxylase
VPLEADIGSITQNSDVRFLGGLLGQVIRIYGGEELYRRIENIRSTSVDRARSIVDASNAKFIKQLLAESRDERE